MKNLRRYIQLALLLLILGLPQLAHADKLKVVATLGDLGAAVRAVGGDAVDVTVLANSREDPHFVDAKPSHVARLADADLLVYNGLSLESGWLPTLVENSRNSQIQSGEPGDFDASAHVEKQGEPDGDIDRSMGDVHPGGNPHYTLAPRQMARVALALGKRLGELKPSEKEAFKKRARAFAKKCLVAAKKWKETFAEVPESRRDVVIYHEAWTYLLDWLELEAAITIEPKPGVEPNPKRVANVVNTIKEGDIGAILKMEYYPGSTVEQIADATDATVITSKGHTREDGDYIDRIEELAQSIHEAIAKP